jgi:hypothetical protein
MRHTPKIGILFSDQNNRDKIGIIEFPPSGMLIFQIFEGLHVFALKPLEKLLNEHFLKIPLYMKYADLLKEKPSLPMNILEQEAIVIADALNGLGQPLTVGKHIVKAEVVRYF